MIAQRDQPAVLHDAVVIDDADGKFEIEILRKVILFGGGQRFGNQFPECFIRMDDGPDLIGGSYSVVVEAQSGGMDNVRISMKLETCVPV